MAHLHGSTFVHVTGEHRSGHEHGSGYTVRVAGRTVGRIRASQRQLGSDAVVVWVIPSQAFGRSGSATMTQTAPSTSSRNETSSVLSDIRGPSTVEEKYRRNCLHCRCVSLRAVLVANWRVSAVFHDGSRLSGDVPLDDNPTPEGPSHFDIPRGRTVVRATRATPTEDPQMKLTDTFPFDLFSTGDDEPTDSTESATDGDQPTDGTDGSPTASSTANATTTEDSTGETGADTSSEDVKTDATADTEDGSSSTTNADDGSQRTCDPSTKWNDESAGSADDESGDSTDDGSAQPGGDDGARASGDSESGDDGRSGSAEPRVVTVERQPGSGGMTKTLPPTGPETTSTARAEAQQGEGPAASSASTSATSDGDSAASSVSVVVGENGAAAASDIGVVSVGPDGAAAASEVGVVAVGPGGGTAASNAANSTEVEAKSRDD